MGIYPLRLVCMSLEWRDTLEVSSSLEKGKLVKLKVIFLWAGKFQN